MSVLCLFMVSVKSPLVELNQQEFFHKFMTIENESKASSNISTAETEHVELPNTTVTDDKEHKNTNRQFYKC